LATLEILATLSLESTIPASLSATTHAATHSPTERISSAAAGELKSTAAALTAHHVEQHFWGNVHASAATTEAPHATTSEHVSRIDQIFARIVPSPFPMHVLVES
jgi:hypothetical protein